VLFKETGQMSRLRLLKLLYIADRESLQEVGNSITGDRAVAMDHGPVLSRTYDIIKGEEHGVERWSQFIARVGRRDLRLKTDPGVDALSAYEVGKLQEVANRFDASDGWEVVEKTHEFPEWQRNRPPGRSSKEIPFEHILEAVGMADHAAEIIADSESFARIGRVLALL
jgi:uncharacterized phage-associated protein